MDITNNRNRRVLFKDIRELLVSFRENMDPNIYTVRRMELQDMIDLITNEIDETYRIEETGAYL